MIAVAAHQRHTRARRCPICDGADGDPRGQGKRCSGFTSADGQYVHCSREDHAGMLAANDAGLYAHWMIGACHCGESHGGTARASTTEATYDYCDEHGVLLFQVVRKPGKQFRQRVPDGAGGWLWKLGDTRRVPYRLPKLIAANPDVPVHITEGEKDANTLVASGLVATCNPGGAGKWAAVADVASSVLRDRHVVIVADRDEPGERHARDVAARLEGVARSIRIVVPVAPHKDVTDVLEAGGTIEDLIPLNASAPIPPTANDDANDLPEIWPTRAEVAEVVNETIAALRPDPDLYVRGASLVRVIDSDGDTSGGVQRDATAPIIRRVVPQIITERISVNAKCMKMTTRGRGENKQKVPVHTAPPAWLASHVIARESYPGFNVLEGVIASPTIRVDGSILQTPGYDRASGLLYRPRCSYPTVPETPSREDAIAARDRLLDVIADFPMTEVSQAAWLAAQLTLVARSLVDGSTPIIAADASTPGSGKGLIARVPHVVSHGTEIAHMSVPPTDEEFRKQITTTLLAGDPAVLIDNVGVPLGGDSIESLVTAPVWKVRLLGKNEDSGAIVPKLIVFVSGNGLEFIGDMGRRVLRIRIDTRQENPEERTDFKQGRDGADKLIAWVKANRATLVVDALTCLRAWHVAGRPGQVKAWGSFESWTNTIAKCVQWLGLSDPTLARATQDAALDPTRQALGAVYHAIRRLAAERGITAGELVRYAFPPTSHGPNEEQELAEAIGTLTPNAHGDNATRARLLGRKLKAGRIIGGYRLDAVPGHAGSVRYSLTSVKP